MRNQFILNWLVRTAATALAIMILATLGAATFGLLGGALCWLLHVEKAPIGFLWIIASGAIAGFLAASLWAIDRIVNRQIYLASMADDARPPVLPSRDGKAIQQPVLEDVRRVSAEAEAPMTKPLFLLSPLQPSGRQRL